MAMWRDLLSHLNLLSQLCYAALGRLSICGSCLRRGCSCLAGLSSLGSLHMVWCTYVSSPKVSHRQWHSQTTAQPLLQVLRLAVPSQQSHDLKRKQQGLTWSGESEDRTWDWDARPSRRLHAYCFSSSSFISLRSANMPNLELATHEGVHRSSLMTSVLASTSPASLH